MVIKQYEKRVQTRLKYHDSTASHRLSVVCVCVLTRMAQIITAELRDLSFYWLTLITNHRLVHLIIISNNENFLRPNSEKIAAESRLKSKNLRSIHSDDDDDDDDDVNKRTFRGGWLLWRCDTCWRTLHICPTSCQHSDKQQLLIQLLMLWQLLLPPLLLPLLLLLQILQQENIKAEDGKVKDDPTALCLQSTVKVSPEKIKFFKHVKMMKTI